MKTISERSSKVATQPEEENPVKTDISTIHFGQQAKGIGEQKRQEQKILKSVHAY